VSTYLEAVRLRHGLQGGGVAVRLEQADVGWQQAAVDEVGVQMGRGLARQQRRQLRLHALERRRLDVREDVLEVLPLQREPSERAVGKRKRERERE
jgi:hypothetical protein